MKEKLMQAADLLHKAIEIEPLLGLGEIGVIAHELQLLSQCTWIKSDDVWNTDCGNLFVFNNPDSPVENGMNYCCFCGAGLIEYTGDVE